MFRKFGKIEFREEKENENILKEKEEKGRVETKTMKWERVCQEM